MIAKATETRSSPRSFEEAFPELEDIILEYRAARPGGAFATDRPTRPRG